MYFILSAGSRDYYQSLYAAKFGNLPSSHKEQSRVSSQASTAVNDLNISWNNADSFSFAKSSPCESLMLYDGRTSTNNFTPSDQSTGSSVESTPMDTQYIQRELTKISASQNSSCSLFSPEQNPVPHWLQKDGSETELDISVPPPLPLLPFDDCGNDQGNMVDREPTNSVHSDAVLPGNKITQRLGKHREIRYIATLRL